MTQNTLFIKASIGLSHRKMKHVPKEPAKQLYHSEEEDKGQREKGKKNTREREFFKEFYTPKYK